MPKFERQVPVVLRGEYLRENQNLEVRNAEENETLGPTMCV
jgi:hypothetical protein